MDRDIQDFNVRLRTITIWELVAGLVIALILSGALMLAVPMIYDSDDLYFVVFLSFIALFFIWALRGTTGLGKNFKNVFEEGNKKEIIFVLITNLLFAFLFTFIFAAADIIIGISDPTWISIFEGSELSYDATAVLFDVIGTVIFAPVLEELMFRGVIFNRLKIRTGIIPAMLISSFIFAIGHEFGGMTSAFLFGICMCILYLKTDNILVPMSVHFLNNILATLIYYSNVDLMAAQMPWLVPCSIISVIGTVYLIRYIIKEARNIKKQYN